MTAKGHMLLSGIVVFAPIAILNSKGYNTFEYLGISNIASLTIFFYSVIFGSLLPDIDEPGSKIGRYFRGLSDIIKSLFGHRGATHTLPFILLWAFIYLISPTSTTMLISLGITFGVIAHIVGDMLTKSGINNFFYPFTPNLTIGLLPKFIRFYTNGLIENFVVIPTLFIANIGVFYLISIEFLKINDNDIFKVILDGFNKILSGI